MKDEYTKSYIEGRLLRLSLDALWHQLSWPPDAKNALTMTQWGPFCLTSTNAPFVPIFIRAADRALYHAENVWRQLIHDLSGVQHLLNPLQSEEILSTHDRHSKYEIEAFLGAAMALIEEDLIGPKKGNRLERSSVLGNGLIAQVLKDAESFRQERERKKWRLVRNSAYHLKPNMRDWGYTATIEKRSGKYVVELNGVHYVEGASPDLVRVFAEAYSALIDFVSRVRDALFLFSLRVISAPQNRRHYWAEDEFGNMLVVLGPGGFECRHFPETASGFVGPVLEA